MNNLNNEELLLLEEILNEEIKSYLYSGYETTSEYIVSIRSIIKKLGLKEIYKFD